MSLLRQYNPATSRYAQRVSLIYEGGTYSGRGSLTTDPSEGVKLEAFFERNGPPLKKTIHFGLVSESPRPQAIRARIGRGSWACIPDVTLRDRFDLIRECRISSTFSRLLRGYRSPKAVARTSASLLLRLCQTPMMPDPLESTSTLGTHPLAKSFTRGLHFERPEITLVAFAPEKGLLELHCATDGNILSDLDLPRLANSLSDAVGILACDSAELLYCVYSRRNRVITDWRRDCEASRLNNLLRMFPEPSELRGEHILKIARCLLADDAKAATCRGIYRQLLDANKQRSLEGIQFICASALGGALRTLFEMPVAERRKDDQFNISRAVTRFREQYLSNDWRRDCGKLTKAFTRLRTRAAHPDWLYTSGGQLSDEQIEQTLDDLVFVSRWLGYMLLAICGFEGLEPRFPAPRSHWGPVVTIAHGQESDSPLNTDDASSDSLVPEEIDPATLGSAE